MGFGIPGKQAPTNQSITQGIGGAGPALQLQPRPHTIGYREERFRQWFYVPLCIYVPIGYVVIYLFLFMCVFIYLYVPFTVLTPTTFRPCLGRDSEFWEEVVVVFLHGNKGKPPQFRCPGVQVELDVAVPLVSPIEHNGARNQEYVFNCAVGLRCLRCLRWTTLVHLFTVAFRRSKVLRIGSLQSDFCEESVLQNALCEKSRKKGV